MTNCKVYIAQSIDGYISDRNNGLDWLHSIPNPENLDLGYTQFMNGIDAIIMGRLTFETVCNFDIDWPYTKPVFVLSNTLKSIDNKLKEKVNIVSGNIPDILKELNGKGYDNLYIDGGTTIQSFLNEDLIDELIITTIPVILGGGSKLFTTTSAELKFKHIETKVLLNEMVQSHFVRKK